MFTVVHISQHADGTRSKEIFDFSTLSEARANNHYFLSSCYANSELVYFMACVLEPGGSVLEKECFSRPPENMANG